MIINGLNKAMKDNQNREKIPRKGLIDYKKGERNQIIKRLY